MSKKTDKDQPAPMDATIREETTGTAAVNAQRVCWAVKTLVAEVHEMFPETPVEFSDFDGRNTALAVSFDLSALDEDTARIDFPILLGALLVDEHARVESVDTDEDAVLVTMRRSARTQDIRESFGLAEAWEILTEGDDSGAVDWEDDPVEPSFITVAEGYPSWGGSL